MTRARELFERPPDEPIRVLDADGAVVNPALEPDLDGETLVAMYRDMAFSRRWDERAVSLQRQGRMGTYSQLAGQEGAQIGSTYALADEDYISFQYREHGVVAARGFPWEYLLYYMGHEQGNAVFDSLNMLPINLTIGENLPHAVGLAWAVKLRGDDRVVAAHFGDGATSEGDFHEAMNFAGVFDTPAVFVCNNNQWAISLPRDRQTVSDTLAGKATAYGFEGVQVDGMDPLATYVVTRAAREKALSPGAGRRRPTLIETLVYRFGAHTTADDPTVYRDEEEVERWRTRDPLDRFEAYLRDRNLLDSDRIATIESEIEETLTEVVERAERFEADPDSMFEHVFAEPTDRLRDQREYLRYLREEYGDGALQAEE